MVFGYFNRNLDEPSTSDWPRQQLSISAARIEGRPTRFLPRRNFFVFKVPVPADFAPRSSCGRSRAMARRRRPFGTLKPDYIINEQIMMMTIGGFGRGKYKGNKAPVLSIDGEDRRTAHVGR